MERIERIGVLLTNSTFPPPPAQALGVVCLCCVAGTQMLMKGEGSKLASCKWPPPGRTNNKSSLPLFLLFPHLTSQ